MIKRGSRRSSAYMSIMKVRALNAEEGQHRLLLRREAMEARGNVEHEPVPPTRRAAPAVVRTVAVPAKRIADRVAQASPHSHR
jgi:hypothetical protein